MKLDYDRPLIAYAYLAQAGAQDDILSGLIPLLTPIAKAKAGKYFERDFLSTELKRLYGIEVHPWALDELVPRMEVAGILRQSSLMKSGAMYTYIDSIETQQNQTTEEDVQEILEDFIEYSRGLMSKSNINLPEDILRKHFFNQIVTADFQVKLTAPRHGNETTTKTLSLRDNTQEDDETTTNSTPPATNEQAQLDHIKIICASYILDASVSKPKVFSQLVKIANGAILAEYILNLREPNTKVTLKSLRIYLDGPLAMSYLDLNEEETCKHTAMLIEKIREKGASLYIFKDHVDEIKDNLRSALSADGSGKRRATHRRMISASFRAYAQGILSDIEGVLKRKQITISPIPRSPSYFSDELMESLTHELGDYGYQARERDAHAVGGVIRLRSGKINSRSFFHECQHIFLTENKRVASVAFNFSIAHLGYKSNYVPPAVTDRYFAGLMFILYGGSSSEALTHQKLLANCASALEPNHTLLTRVTNFLSDVNSQRANSFIEMMTSARSSQYRAIYLLDEKKVIHTLSDAEAAFTDFEEEITQKLSATYKAEQARIEHEHAEKVASLTAKATEQELKTIETEENYQAIINEKENELEEIRNTLNSMKYEHEKLTSRLSMQEAESKTRQLNEIQDLLALCVDEIKNKNTIKSRLWSVAGLVIATIFNYWSFCLVETWQKFLCAPLLVIVPITFSSISKKILTHNIAAQTRRKFEKSVKQRSHLKHEISNYVVNYNTGTVTPLPDDTLENLSAI